MRFLITVLFLGGLAATGHAGSFDLSNWRADDDSKENNLVYAVGGNNGLGIKAVFAMQIVKIEGLGAAEVGASPVRGRPNAIIEFKIVEVIDGKYRGLEKGDVRELLVWRATGFESYLDQDFWSTEDVGDTFVVFVPRLNISFGDVISNPNDLRKVEASELDGELRDLKFVMDVCQRPVAEQYAMEHVLGHIEKHKIDDLGGFLSTYVFMLYLRKRDAAPFAIYDYVAKAGKGASSSRALPFLIEQLKGRAYSSRVSDDSLATYILAVLKEIRFRGDLERIEISGRQASILSYQANHILNLTRKERKPSNWARLLRIRRRSEIGDEIDWLAKFRKRLPEAADETEQKLHKRIDALITRFRNRGSG